jgi:ABC-type multidrug transport system fused ATPase/permease subunit
MISMSCLVTSKNLHNLMVVKILRAPVSFFDSTPIGRILTRLSQDIGAFDFTLTINANFVFNNGFRVISIAILICIAIPFMVVPVIVVIIVTLYLRKYTIDPQNDCKRYDSITKATINTKIGSVQDGITSIRAYKKQDYFVDRFMDDVDINCNVLFTYHGVARWSQTRLDATSFLFILTNAFVIVILQNHTDYLNVIVASISFQLSMEFGINLSYLIRMTGELENIMTR